MKIEIEDRKAEEYPSKDISLCDTAEEFIKNNTWVSLEEIKKLVKARVRELANEAGLFYKGFADIVQELNSHCEVNKRIKATKSHWEGVIMDAHIDLKNVSSRYGYLIVVIDGVKYEFAIYYNSEATVITILSYLKKYNSQSKASEAFRSVLSIMTTAWWFIRGCGRDCSKEVLREGVRIRYEVVEGITNIRVIGDSVYEVSDIHKTFDTFDEFIHQVLSKIQ